jgi:hypothetical protein
MYNHKTLSSHPLNLYNSNKMSNVMILSTVGSLVEMSVLESAKKLGCCDWFHDLKPHCLVLFVTHLTATD